MSSHANMGLTDFLATKYLAERDPARKQALFEQFNQSRKRDNFRLDGKAFLITLAVLFGPWVAIMAGYAIS